MNGSIIHIFDSSLFNKIINFQSFVCFLFLVAPAYSLSFRFPSSNQNKVIDYQNDASISSGAIELTKSTVGVKDLGSSVGRASYSDPVRLWDKHTNKTTNFTTHFSFNITQIVNDTELYGDGLTFFLTSFNDSTAHAPDDSAGMCLGLLGGSKQSICNVTSYPIVGVEFDTYYNKRWDPTNYSNYVDHVGIDVNSTKSKVTFPVYDGLKFRNQTANTWITYDSSTKNLSVFLTYDENHVFNGESNLSHVIDLKAILPETVRVGFSSSTGASYERHTILSWEFNSTLVDDDNDSPPIPTTDPTPSKGKAGIVGGLVAGTSVLIIGLGFVVWWGRRSRGSTYSNDDLYFVDDDGFAQETGPRRFTYNGLSRATNNFAEEGKLGQGGFGGVYRGFLPSMNREIAVKKISSGSQQGKKEYMSEVKVISRLRHKNLVQLIGWCHEGENLLLVYEFMLNGSLDSYLYAGKEEAILPWAMRYKIAQELASVLLYLHQDWEQCVLHRDIKSSNVMLDSNFNAKLGDFGLARLVDHKVGSQTTALAGTLGYLAPECVIAGKASKETDVYSFGVVALEIGCGRRPVEPKEEPSKVNMVEWVWNLYGKGCLLDAIDKRLEGEFNAQEVESLLMVGLWCSHPDHTSRPSIRQAINVLNFESPLPSLPLNFPVLSFCVPETHVNTSYATPSSSGITGSSDTKSSASHSVVPGTFALFSDNDNV